MALSFLWDFIVPSAHACVGCGFTASFTPKILVISMGFVLLPLSLVGYMFWRLSGEVKSKNIDGNK